MSESLNGPFMQGPAASSRPPEGSLAQALAMLMQVHAQRNPEQAPQGRLSRELLATREVNGPITPAPNLSIPGGGYSGLTSGVADAVRMWQQQQGQESWGKAGYGSYQAENTGGGGLFGGASGGLKSGYGS